MRLSRRLKREIRIWIWFVPAIILLTVLAFQFIACLMSYMDLLKSQNEELRQAIIYYLREEPGK